MSVVCSGVSKWIRIWCVNRKKLSWRVCSDWLSRQCFRRSQPVRSPSTIAAVEQLRSAVLTDANPMDEPARPFEATPRETPSFIATLGRFLQAAIAGVILGGGIGILAAAMLGLSPVTAQITIFASALTFALACGGISLNRGKE